MSTFVKKPGGSELIWTHTDRYVGKVISINAGARLSLQFHHEKDESIYVVEGTLNLHLENDEGEVEQVKMGPAYRRRQDSPLRGHHRREAHRGVIPRTRRRRPPGR